MMTSGDSLCIWTSNNCGFKRTCWKSATTNASYSTRHKHCSPEIIRGRPRSLTYYDIEWPVIHLYSFLYTLGCAHLFMYQVMQAYNHQVINAYRPIWRSEVTWLTIWPMTLKLDTVVFVSWQPTRCFFFVTLDLNKEPNARGPPPPVPSKDTKWPGPATGEG